MKRRKKEETKIRIKIIASKMNAFDFLYNIVDHNTTN